MLALIYNPQKRFDRPTRNHNNILTSNVTEKRITLKENYKKKAGPPTPYNKVIVPL